MKESEAIDLLTISGCQPEVIEHCRAVAGYSKTIAIKILKCSELKGELRDIDIELVYLGGLLHDIGRSRTHGIWHAVEGARIAVENDLDSRLVNIIERHIGAGISRTEALDLGLPERDYFPLTIEEKIVAHADNLVAGSRISTPDKIVEKLKKKNISKTVINRIIELNNEMSGKMCH